MRVGFWCACLQDVLFWEVTVSAPLGLCLHPLFICSLFLQLQLLRNLFASTNGLQLFVYKTFSQNCFCGSFGINLSVGRDTGRGKVAYSWISPNPVKAGPTLGVVAVVCRKYQFCHLFSVFTCLKELPSVQNSNLTYSLPKFPSVIVSFLYEVL